MNNFTPRAQQVLALARKEADRFNHNYVGTEHLLLGLIQAWPGRGRERPPQARSRSRNRAHAGRAAGRLRP
ncbi:MAG: Clp protease N-terminal domain-containing protein [Prosthecobacter sp.]